MGATSVVLTVALFAGAGSPGFMPEMSLDFDRMLEGLFPLCYESPFVAVPATMGAVVGGVAGGAAGAVVAAPAFVVEGLAGAGHPDGVPVSAGILGGGAFVGAIGGHYVVGGPAYVAKLVLWDGPKALWEGLGWVGWW